MSIASLALVLVLAPGAGPDPSTLVARLGASRYAEREAAADALEALGRDALEALRAARADRDAEVQVRAEALLERIENGLLTRPTLVRLDVRDRPLSEVLREVGEQTGVALVLHGLAAEEPRVTLRAPEPLPFWKAMDKLGLVGLWGRDPQSGRPREARPVLHLAPRRDPAAPACDGGPFRVDLRGLYGGRGSYTLKLSVMAEPRLRIAPDGRPARLIEAVDDRGQTYTAAGDWRCDLQLPSMAGLGDAPSPQVSVLGRLTGPSRPGRTLKRLRGAVPVAVAARKLEPVVIPLNAPAKGAAKKLFSNDEYTAVVGALRDSPDGQSSILDLVVMPHKAPEPDPFPMRGRRRFDPRFYGIEQWLQEQVEVVDARGRPLNYGIPPRRFPDRDAMRVGLIIEPKDAAVPPAEVRYHDTIRTTTEVEFELTDIPLP
jgi:hypothetical protein